MKKITLLCFLLSSIFTFSQTQLLSRLDETYNGTTWEISSGFNYEYDSNNNLKTETGLQRDGTSWVEFYKIVNTIVNNKLTEQITQGFDFILNGLQNS